MAKHTQLEYGKLLKEQLEKLGMRVGLHMRTDERGWEGTLILARGDVRSEDGDEDIVELHSDVFVYVDDEGAIRVHYSEPIIVDPEKKARYDAWQEEKKRIEEDMQLHPEKYFILEDEADHIEASEADREEMQSAEDLLHISEEQELKLLRALNNEYLKMGLYNRENANRLIYHGRYRMEACSRSSAKKAAVYICDELFVACGSIEYLSKQLGFVRVKPKKKWESWADSCIVGDIIDDFSQIEGYLAAKRRAKQKQKLSRDIKEKESAIEWIIREAQKRPCEAIYDKSEEIIEWYRREIAGMQAEIAALEQEEN